MARVDRHNRVHFWRDREIPGLSCLHADFTRHEFAPHAHAGFVIAVTEEGGARFESRGADGEAVPERLLAFNPDEPHSGRLGDSPRWHYRALYLDEPGFSTVLAGLGLARPAFFRANQLADPEMIAHFRALHTALEADADRLRIEELLVSGFGQLFARHGCGTRPDPGPARDRDLLDAVVARMADQPTANPGLEDLGAAVGLTAYQLIGLFKRTTGLTPHAFLTQIRVRAAAGALKSGRSIADAASLAGFYDQAALTNQFKRTFGVTPRQFAAAYAG